MGLFRKKDKAKEYNLGEERNKLARKYYGMDYKSLCSIRKRVVDSAIESSKLPPVKVDVKKKKTK